MRAAVSKAVLGLAVLGIATATARPATAGAMTYLALGDSIAFGEGGQPDLPTYGDRGYVSRYADSLAAANGGVRPHVVNLAISGETTTSFFGGGSIAAPLNLNYSSVTTSQNTMLISRLAAERDAGRTVGAVTVSLGANDLFATVGAAGFFAKSPEQQQAALLGAMSAVQNNYTALLTEVKALAPSAAVTLVGYYNPYAAAHGSPLAPIAGPAIQLLNAVIAGQAAAFGARYVDTYTPFLGREAQYTHIANGFNPHPNALGYESIAHAMTTPVPEPTAMAVLGMLGVGLVGRAARRRLAPAA